MIANSLKYLLESLSNYEEDELSQYIFEKIEQVDYEAEIDFVEDLEEEEIEYLDSLLEREIKYAKNVQDDIRVRELSEIYELLF